MSGLRKKDQNIANCTQSIACHRHYKVLRVSLQECLFQFFATNKERLALLVSDRKYVLFWSCQRPFQHTRAFYGQGQNKSQSCKHQVLEDGVYSQGQRFFKIYFYRHFTNIHRITGQIYKDQWLWGKHITLKHDSLGCTKQVFK